MPPAPSISLDPKITAAPRAGQSVPLALTMGEPAGIGPDITLAVWQMRQSRDIPPFIVVGCPDVLRERARHLGLSIPIEIIDDPADATAAFQRGLPVHPIGHAGGIRPGHPDPKTGAIDDCRDRDLRGAGDAWRGLGHRHQPHRQKRPLCRRVRAPWPHRISGGPRPAPLGSPRPARHDDRQRCPQGRAV